MYEEEDDHLPMAFRNVAFRPDIPQKFRDYSLVHMGMREMGADPEALAKQDNEDRVNSLFAAAFPRITGYQQPRQQTDSMAAMSPSTFQPANFMATDWQNASALSPTTILPAVQSPGLPPFQPEMQRKLSNSSHTMVRTPSHESFTMRPDGSTPPTRSAAMERQGSGASTLSHGLPIWPPASPCTADFDSFFAGGPHSATTPMPLPHGMPQSRSMSVPFPTESRGNRRRRDDSTSAQPSPTYGLGSRVSPTHHAAIPPAKRNRSDAGLAAYGHMHVHCDPPSATAFPFSRDMPGNVQGMLLQSPPGSIDYQAAHQQALAHGRFQQGLAHQQQGAQAVPQLQAPPRRARGSGQARAMPVKTTSQEDSGEESDASFAHAPQAEVEEANHLISAKPAAQATSRDEKQEAAVVENQAEQDEHYSFNGIGFDPFGNQDDGNDFADFNFSADGPMSDWNVDGGQFNIDDLLQFPASQPDE